MSATMRVRIKWFSRLYFILIMNYFTILLICVHEICVFYLVRWWPTLFDVARYYARVRRRSVVSKVK